MEIEVSKTIREKVIINFPHFRKSTVSSGYHWKLISEHDGIVVLNMAGGHFGIERGPYQAQSAINNGEECTEDEFNAAFEAIKIKINAL